MYYHDRNLAESMMNDQQRQIEEQRLAKRIKKRRGNIK